MKEVRGLDLSLRRDGCFALLGPNRPTEPSRCALGLTTPSAGRIRLAGLPVPARPAKRTGPGRR